MGGNHPENKVVLGFQDHQDRGFCQFLLLFHRGKPVGSSGEDQQNQEKQKRGLPFSRLESSALTIEERRVQFLDVT